jgi:hypothetical protein
MLPWCELPPAALVAFSLALTCSNRNYVIISSDEDDIDFVQHKYYSSKYVNITVNYTKTEHALPARLHTSGGWPPGRLLATSYF